MANKLEREYQKHIINVLEEMFPDALVSKMDSSYIQGIPDLVIFWNDRWAMLETKRDIDAPCRPNQEYYVNLLNRMSFAAIIYPENEEEVFYALEQSFRDRG